jgi:uncharacterized membrane-anchored protein YitT (DUF2179 family)
MELFSDNSKLREIFHFCVITIGACIAAMGLQLFLMPVNILDGGVVGVSFIINYLTKLPMGLVIVVLNIPFFILGYRQMGKSFVIKATYAMILFSVMLEVLEPLDATYDELLATVFGGIFLGLGVGLVLKCGGCIDGTEAAALLISKKTRLSVGQIILGINIVIYSVAGCLFGLDRAMYSLITYFITSKVVDMIETGFEQAKAVMIITNNANSIADNIYKRLGRTVTIMEGEGLISGKKVVLYCVVTRLELSELYKIIRADDNSAFVTVSDVSEIVGKHIKKKKEE